MPDNGNSSMNYLPVTGLVFILQLVSVDTLGNKITIPVAAIPAGIFRIPGFKYEAAASVVYLELEKGRKKIHTGTKAFESVQTRYKRVVFKGDINRQIDALSI